VRGIARVFVGDDGWYFANVHCKKAGAGEKIYFFPLDTEINGSIFRAIEEPLWSGSRLVVFFPTATGSTVQVTRLSAN
jgi:hypothetical protein